MIFAIALYVDGSGWATQRLARRVNSCEMKTNGMFATARSALHDAQKEERKKASTPPFVDRFKTTMDDNRFSHRQVPPSRFPSVLVYYDVAPIVFTLPRQPWCSRK